MRDDEEKNKLKQLQDNYFAVSARLRELLAELKTHKGKIREVGRDLLNPDLSPEMMEQKRAHIASLEQELSPLTEAIEYENHQLALFNQGIGQLVAVMQPFAGVANPNPDDVMRALQSIGLLTTQPAPAAGDAKKDEVKDSGLRKT